MMLPGRNYSPRRFNVLKGVGAVLVFLGIGCLITGTILTSVALMESETNIHPAFIYVGPALMTSSLCFVLIGYLFGRIDTVCLLVHIARHSRQYGDIEEDEELAHAAYEDSVCLLCMKCVLCCCVRNNETAIRFATIENTNVAPSSNPRDKLLRGSYDESPGIYRPHNHEMNIVKSERESKLLLVSQYLESIPTSDTYPDVITDLAPDVVNGSESGTTP